MRPLDPHPAQILNLGIVAHVDAGKTTLTERLLYAAGASTRIGRVDHGDTVTDSDALERERGITIHTAVAALTLGELQVNLVDTPGHADFVAEVERALAVLDGVVLVVSAVEGVQAHTRVLITVLLRLGLPFLIFVNKIDRVGARDRALLTELGRLLPGSAVALTDPAGLGTPAASVQAPVGAAAERLAEELAGIDDQLLDDYVSGRWPPAPDRLRGRLHTLVRRRAVHPVYLGAALAGIGVQELITGLPLLAAEPSGSQPRTTGAQAEIFKITRTDGARTVYVRVRSGELRPRMRVDRLRRAEDGRIDRDRQLITGVERYDRGGSTRHGAAGAGDIARISGLRDPRIGDQLGRWRPSAAVTGFRRPGLETIAAAKDPAQRGPLRRALQAMTEEDPLIDVQVDEHDARLIISLYGEIQRQVIAERLRREYGIEAIFTEPTPAYIEQVTGVGEAISPMRRYGFAAGVGLRIEPAPMDEPLRIDRAVEHGILPRAFFTAITETLPRALRQGRLGWPVLGCRIVIISTDYAPHGSAGGDFRHLVPLVLAEALGLAGTRVLEPYSQVEVDLPEAAGGPVLDLLGSLGATEQQPRFASEGGTIRAMLPTGQMTGLELQLDALTGGRGAVAAQPAGHRPMARPWPHRPRTDDNPYDPDEYLRLLSLR